MVGLVLFVATVSGQPQTANAPHPVTTQALVDRWQTELSNWGRWGKDDTLGAANLITAAKRQQAMALAKTGAVVSLERRVVLSPKPEESQADASRTASLSTRFASRRFRRRPAWHCWLLQ
jgi:hypothetical protein